VMSLAQIESESRKAARRSAAAGLTPLVVSDPSEVYGAPFIGDRVPRGWMPLMYADLKPESGITTERRGFYGGDPGLGILLFVDSTGWGGSHEPALELAAVERAVVDILAATDETVGFAIYEVGEFQAHLRAFRNVAKPTRGTPPHGVRSAVGAGALQLMGAWS